MRKLYGIQEQISANYLREFVGKRCEVICDGIDYDRNCFVGRTFASAPEIDGKVYFHAPQAEQGERYEIIITESDNYDLFGKTEDYDEFTQ